MPLADVLAREFLPSRRRATRRFPCPTRFPRALADVSGNSERSPLTASPRHAFPDTPAQVDRFIPNRSALDLDIAHYNLVKENASANDLDLAGEVISPSKVRSPTRSPTRARGNERSRVLPSRASVHPKISPPARTTDLEFTPGAASRRVAPPHPSPPLVLTL